MHRTDRELLKEIDNDYRYRKGCAGYSLLGDIWYDFNPLDLPFVTDIMSAENPDELREILNNFAQVLSSFHPEAVTPLCASIVNAIKSSPGIQMEVAPGGNGFQVISSGASLLDIEVVNPSLAWLSVYPEVLQHYEAALKIHNRKDADSYRNLLDDLRWALEQLLRSILNNQVRLEEQAKHLGLWLKKRGVNVYIREMFTTLLTHFAKYQNDAVKHDEKWQLADVEFMIYLTGIFMRLLLQLNLETQNEQ